MYKLFQYNDNDFRLVCLKSDIHKNKSNNNDNSYIPQTDSEEVKRIKLSRSKRFIREIALCNNFNYFFTATVNSELCDRYSLTAVQDSFRKILKRIKRKHSDFIYLFITEKHKDGAFHFHGLCSNLDLYTNFYGYYSSRDFDLLGFNSFSVINDKSKCSNYICKYITKDCIENEAGSVYFCSRGLKRATSYEIAPIDFSHIFSKREFSNDFCRILDYRLDELSQDELIYLQYNLKDIKSFYDKLMSFPSFI